MTIDQLNTLSDRDYLAHLWGESVLNVIDAQHKIPMSFDEFLTHCTACGGNWGGMLLTGIRKFYPEVWEAIPDNMTHFAWNCICITCDLLEIK